MRRRTAGSGLLPVALLVLGALLAAACGDDDDESSESTQPSVDETGADQEPVDYEFGVIASSAGEWPSYVMKDQGFDLEHGLSVELVTMGGAPASIQGVLGGEVPVAEVTIDGIITAVNNGADIRFVGGSLQYYRAMVASKSDITSLEQLRGKTVSIVGENNPTYFLLADALEQVGVTSSEWEWTAQPVPSATRYAGLTSGAVDAALLTSPVDFQAEREGFNLLVDLGELYPKYGFTAIAASPDTASNDPNLAAFVAAYADAINWLLDPANEEEARRILSEAIPAYTADDIQQSYDIVIAEKQGFAKDAVLPEETIDEVQTRLADAGVIDGNRPVSDYVAGIG